MSGIVPRIALHAYAYLLATILTVAEYLLNELRPCIRLSHGIPALARHILVLSI